MKYFDGSMKSFVVVLFSDVEHPPLSLSQLCALSLNLPPQLHQATCVTIETGNLKNLIFKIKDSALSIHKLVMHKRTAKYFMHRVRHRFLQHVDKALISINISWHFFCL